jgi:hypothetical protein
VRAPVRSLHRPTQIPPERIPLPGDPRRRGLPEVRTDGGGTQALLAIALVVVVLRINLYNLPLPGGGGVASRHANFPVQAETVQSGAALPL